MSLSNISQIQNKATISLNALTPKLGSALPTINSSNNIVSLGMNNIKEFDNEKDAKDYFTKLDAVLKPFRDEIETDALNKIKVELTS